MLNNFSNFPSISQQIQNIHNTNTPSPPCSPLQVSPTSIITYIHVMNLPFEILFLIFTHLAPINIVCAQQVCKAWNKVTNDDRLWCTFFLHTFPGMYQDIREPSWRERFAKCYVIHSNWRTGRAHNRVLREHIRSIRQIQLNNDYLAFAYADVIEVRDPKTHAEKFCIQPEFREQPYIKCFYLHQNRLACSAGNNWSQVNLYNLEEEGRLTAGWSTFETTPIDAIAFNDSMLVTGSRKCVVWDLQTRVPIHTFSEQQRGVVNCLQFDDQMLACSHKGRKVRIWDIKSGKRTFTLQGHLHLVHCLQYNDKYMATGSKDKTLRIWDKRKGFNCVAVLRGHTESVRALQLNDWKVISGSKDGDVRIWEISSPFPNSVSLPTHSAFNPFSLPNLDTNPSLQLDQYQEEELLNTSVTEITESEHYTDIKNKSLFRFKVMDPVFSLAASSSHLYVGTHVLQVYDFSKPPSRSKIPMLDKLRDMFDKVRL